jgi:hypothetical protein
VKLERRVFKESRDLQEPLGLLELQELLERLGHKDHKG